MESVPYTCQNEACAQEKLALKARITHLEEGMVELRKENAELRKQTEELQAKVSELESKVSNLHMIVMEDSSQAANSVGSVDSDKRIAKTSLITMPIEIDLTPLINKPDSPNRHVSVNADRDPFGILDNEFDVTNSNHCKLEKEIGRGSFGIVTSGQVYGQPAAIKSALDENRITL